jgi:hypothetical protein
MRRIHALGAALLALGAAACAANTRTTTYGGTVPSRSDGLGPASAGAGGTKEPDRAGVTAADNRGKPAPPRETVRMGGGVAETKAAMLTRSWPTESRDAAVALELKLGPPAEVDDAHLTWNNAGGWKRITVHRAGEADDTHLDVIDVVVDYDVKGNELAENVARLNAGLAVQGESNEISAWCETEALCILALNVANDIVSGRLSLEQAREEYERAVAAFRAGEQVPYTQGLQFELRTPRREPR